jgi:pilus assembly protein Flp/PilA
MARWRTLSDAWDRAAVRVLALRHDRRGVTAIEYGLIAAGIAAVIVVAIVTMGDVVGAMFTDTADAVDQAIG